MVSSRKWRVVALAVTVTVIVFLLYTNRDAADWPSSDISIQVPGSSLIELANDAKVDAAINREISKVKDGEVDTDKETLPKKSSTETEIGDYDPATDFVQIRALAPMTIFSKTYCPYSKKLKQLLQNSYSITPEPTIVELDKHKHGKELQEYLGKLTGRTTVPNVLVGVGSVESRGGSDDFEKFHESGKLANLLNAWGDKTLQVKRIEKPSNV